MSFAKSSESAWLKAPEERTIPAVDEVVVWRMSLADVDTAESSILSRDEIERADRLKFPEARCAFIQGRLFLRRMLGRLLKRPPAGLAFASEGNGKPVLADGDLAFNLSHSGGEALLAVSGASPVGVDIESIRPERDLIGLAKRYFAPTEVEELLRLPSDNQVLGFYTCWTRKEAFIKAIGEGLSHPLDSFAVNLTPGDAPTFRTPMPDWRVFNLELGERFAGAVVVPTAIQRLTCFQLESL
jgi:4'-phosphopantetheinyl transferase